MTTAKVLLAAAAAALLAGCGEKCPSETPEVRAIESCSAAPATTVSVRLQLCPTCNQVVSSCSVDVQGGTVFLDPVVEACESSSGCPAQCEARPSTCTFLAPTDPGTYTIEAFDPATNGTRTATLEVDTNGPYSCAFASL